MSKIMAVENAKSWIWRCRVGCILVVVLQCAAGCNDPYSKRRIAMRNEQFNATAKSIADREADGSRRVREDCDSVKKWWKADVDEFNRRIPTIGDYFW